MKRPKSPNAADRNVIRAECRAEQMRAQIIIFPLPLNQVEEVIYGLGNSTPIYKFTVSRVNLK